MISHKLRWFVLQRIFFPNPTTCSSLAIWLTRVSNSHITLPLMFSFLLIYHVLYIFFLFLPFTQQSQFHHIFFESLTKSTDHEPNPQIINFESQFHQNHGWDDSSWVLNFKSQLHHEPWMKPAPLKQQKIQTTQIKWYADV